MSEVKYPERIVYPEYSNEGVRFALGESGKVYAYAKGIPVEQVAQLGDKEGKPWIPKHKNFNSLCRQMVREGDVDHIINRRKADLMKAELLRKSAPEMLGALITLKIAAENVSGEHVYGLNALEVAIQVAEQVIAKATGEQS